MKKQIYLYHYNYNKTKQDRFYILNGINKTRISREYYNSLLKNNMYEEKTYKLNSVGTKLTTLKAKH